MPPSDTRPDLGFVERRQSLCPNCTDPQPRAHPFSVTEGNGVRVIGYQCPICEHVWHVNAAPELVRTLSPES